MEAMVPRRRLRPVAALAAVLGLAIAAVAPAGAVGSDPGLPQQWGLAQIGATSAWAGGAVVGEGVPIAVIDTGIDRDHEDLRDRIDAAVTCTDTGGDPRRCRVDGADIQGHGSHVAGIAAATANSVGVSGVAPGARIIAVRVFIEDGEGGYSAASSDINAGIRWVLANVGRNGVINLSLGGNFAVTSVFGTSFADGINDAWNAGWVPVLASGNENFLGLGSSNYGTLPALVVGATGRDDQVASYSSPTGNAQWGIVAPGGDATSSDRRPPCEANPGDCVLSTYVGGQYGYLQGTSMATPHVAGAAALLLGGGLSNSDTVRRLLDTANKTVACGSRCHGRLDVAKAAAGLAPRGVGGGGSGGAGGAGAGGTSVGVSPTTAAPRSPDTTAPRRTPARTTAGTSIPSAPAETTAPETTAPSTADSTPVPEEVATATADAVTDLPIEEALEVAADPPSARPDPPAGLVAVAGLAALAVTGWAGAVAWRRRAPA